MSKPKLARSNSLNQTDLAKAVANLKDVNCTEHWLRKMKTTFNIVDIHRTGLITKDHLIVEYLDRVARLHNLNPEDEAGYRESVTVWVEDFFQKVDSMTFEHFYKTQYIIITNPEIRAAYGQRSDETFGRQFQMIDTNQDGIISKQEWRMYFRFLGIEDEKEADEAFDAIDLNEDGVLSYEEYKEGAKDFIFNQEPGRYDRFMGPLAEL